MYVPVCLNSCMWRSASPLRLCWTWGFLSSPFPQKKGLGIGKRPQNASIIDGWCVCLNLYVCKTASPLRLCWTWGLSELSSPQQMGPEIGRMPQNASLTDGRCVCLCAWICMCENLHHSSACVGREDCLNSPLHNKRDWDWGSAKCLQVLASLMDGVCACMLELVCMKICITSPWVVGSGDGAG